jgi:hypothetical protein
MAEVTGIDQLIDQLPTDNLTVKALRALDFVAPGQWDNPVGWDNTLRLVTGETDMGVLQAVSDRARELYADPSQQYQRAMWLYGSVDNADRALGLASLANKVGEKVGILSFLSRITPKADKTQAVDLSVKLVAEVVGFCLVNGLPGDSIGDFVGALTAYERESLIRMSALVAFDGVVPLGPDFVDKAMDTVGSLGEADLAANPIFGRIQSLIPGGGIGGQLGFVRSSMDAVQGWMRGFATERGVTQGAVVENLRRFIDVSDDKLDYLAGFLDTSTNYFEHTGTQLLGRRLIERAMGEI